MDITSILGVKDLREARSVVCVQPHPDDNEVGAGGTLALLAKAGCRIVFVTVTDGRYGTSDPAMDPHALAEIRRNEKERAGALLHVAEQVDLGFEDGGSYSERDVMKALLPILRDECPELVMTVDPWMPYEAHPDHYKTGRATAAAVLCAQNIAFPDAGRPCYIPQMAFYASSYPNVYVDVTNHWQTKMDAIFAHKSQFDHEEWPLLQQFFAYQAMQAHQKLLHQETLPKNKRPANMDLTHSQRFAEAFKVLSTRQLHFFPTAMDS